MATNSYELVRTLQGEFVVSSYEFAAKYDLNLIFILSDACKRMNKGSNLINMNRGGRRGT